MDSQSNETIYGSMGRSLQQVHGSTSAGVDFTFTVNPDVPLQISADIEASQRSASIAPAPNNNTDADTSQSATRQTSPEEQVPDPWNSVSENYRALIKETAQMMGRSAIPVGQEKSPQWHLYSQALDEIVSLSS